MKKLFLFTLLAILVVGCKKNDVTVIDPVQKRVINEVVLGTSLNVAMMAMSQSMQTPPVSAGVSSPMQALLQKMQGETAFRKAKSETIRITNQVITGPYGGTVTVNGSMTGTGDGNSVNVNGSFTEVFKDYGVYVDNNKYIASGTMNVAFDIKMTSINENTGNLTFNLKVNGRLPVTGPNFSQAGVMNITCKATIKAASGKQTGTMTVSGTIDGNKVDYTETVTQ